MLSCVSCVYAVRHGCGDGSVVHVCGGGGAFGSVMKFELSVLRGSL